MRPKHPYGKPDKNLAWKQWVQMVNILSSEMGIKVKFTDPQPNLYDMAFACDPGLWINDIFIASNFWAKPRQPEAEYFKAWFRNQGIQVMELSPDAYFEGGDCLFADNKLLIGWGNNRTNQQGILEIKKVLEPRGVPVIPIRRITEEFYHLNSVMAHYPSVGILAYYSPAFEIDTRKIIESNFPSAKIFALSNDEAMRHHPAFGDEYIYSYTLNSIERNGKVIMPYCSSKLHEFLSDAGLRVIVPESGSSEFERSGGSYRCLTMIHNKTK